MHCASPAFGKFAVNPSKSPAPRQRQNSLANILPISKSAFHAGKDSLTFAQRHSSQKGGLIPLALLAYLVSACASQPNSAPITDIPPAIQDESPIPAETTEATTSASKQRSSGEPELSASANPTEIATMATMPEAPSQAPKHRINNGRPLTPLQNGGLMAIDFPERIYMAACGPLTLYGFLKATGREIGIQEAMDAAYLVGWGPGKGGMGAVPGRDNLARSSGRQAVIDMFKNYGVTLIPHQKPDWEAVKASIDRSLPVVVHVVGLHYALLQDYRYDDKGQLQLDMGNTYKILKTSKPGQRWFYISEMDDRAPIVLLIPDPDLSPSPVQKQIEAALVPTGAG